MDRAFEIIEFINDRKHDIKEFQNQINKAEIDLKAHLVKIGQVQFLKVDYNAITLTKRRQDNQNKR